MPTVDIVKAWKDEDYRDTLTSDQQAQLPPHPAGLVEFGVPELDDESLFGPEVRKCKYITRQTMNRGVKCR